MTQFAFTISREQLLKPLQLVSAPLSHRPATPILGHVLLQISHNTLHLTSTDLEIEMSLSLPLLHSEQDGEITVPAKKWADICRSLPNDAIISMQHQANRLTITSGRSRFSLATLPAQEYPNIEHWQEKQAFELPQAQLKKAMSAVHFSMANQDVRYYLNGMLFEFSANTLQIVATDGHRLAMSAIEINTAPQAENSTFILPRKSALELMKLLQENDENVRLALDGTNLRVHLPNMTLTTKLIDGRYPDYRRVLPQDPDKTLQCSGEILKQALLRVAILSNEKFKGVRLNIEKNQLTLSANNPEKEEAEEIIDVRYPHEPIEIAFNVTYLIDILNALSSETISFHLKNATGSVQIQNDDMPETLYVVMPMRL